MGVYYNPGLVSDGLVLALDADNIKSYPGSGTTWYDIASTNNGTLVNGPTFSGSNPSYFRFDNTNDYVQLPASLGYTSEVSAFAWFRSIGSPTGGYHIIFGPTSLEISIPSGGAIRTGIVTNTRYVSNHGSGLTDGNWHYVGFTFEGTTKNSYIDGVFVGGQTTAGTLNFSFGDRTMGRFGGSSAYYLNGDISNARIYNRALTPTEITQNYNISKGRFGI